MSELGIIAIIFLSGWMILSGFGMRNWGIIPLGFLTGTFLVVVVGLVLVVTGLPTYPWVILLAGLLVSSGAILLVKLRSGPRLPIGLLAVGLSVLVPLVMAFRGANLVSYHIDSFRYLVGSGLLAANSYGFASLNLLEARLLSAPVVHSLAAPSGEWYLRSHSPLLSLAILGLLAWAVSQGGIGATQRRVFLVTILAVLLVATNNRMIFNSFYINDHLIFGGAFLVACSASWLLARKAESKMVPEPLIAAIVLALPTLVVTRPEGFIAGALAILPLVLSGSVSARIRMVVLSTHAFSTLAWFGFVTMARYQAGSVPVTTVGPALAGLVGLALVPTLVRTDLSSWRRRTLVTVETGLWLALLIFVARDPGILTQSLRATYENIVRGAGSWGYSLVILGVIALPALILGKDQALVHLRFPLTTFIPVFLLLAYLRDGAYRVGQGDSLNRMLMQVVPALVLYLAASALSRSAESVQFTGDLRQNVPPTRQGLS